MSVMQESRHRTSEEKRAVAATARATRGSGERRVARLTGPACPVVSAAIGARQRRLQLAFCRARAFALDVSSLRKALQVLSERHASLRTTFQERDGEPVQVVHQDREVAVAEIDARDWDEDRLYQEVSAEAHRPFALQSGPLFRGTVFVRSECDYVLLFTVHHIIADFWSLVVLMSDLRQIFRPAHEAGDMRLPPLRLKYADYVRWQRDLLAGPQGERLWDYWREQLGGELPLLDVPTDRPYSAVQSDRGAAVNFSIEPPLALALSDLARSRGLTLFTLLLAAYQVLLHRYSRQNDVLVGSPVACRDKLGFEQIVGCFTNMVVFRSQLQGSLSFSGFVEKLRTTVLDALEHQNYPFSLLVERLHPVRDPSRAPLFQAAFLMEKSHRLEERGAAAMMMGQASARLELGGFVMEPFGLRAEATPFELSLIIEESGKQLAGCLQYNADLFDALTIERLVASYRHVIEAIVADPDQQIADIPIVPQNEREKLLCGFNATEAERVGDMCCHELIALQARRTPEATALIFDDRRMTYRELDERSTSWPTICVILALGRTRSWGSASNAVATWS